MIMVVALLVSGCQCYESSIFYPSITVCGTTKMEHSRPHLSLCPDFCTAWVHIAGQTLSFEFNYWHHACHICQKEIDWSKWFHHRLFLLLFRFATRNLCCALDWSVYGRTWPLALCRNIIECCLNTLECSHLELFPQHLAHSCQHSYSFLRSHLTLQWHYSWFLFIPEQLSEYPFSLLFHTFMVRHNIFLYVNIVSLLAFDLDLVLFFFMELFISSYGKKHLFLQDVQSHQTTSLSERMVLANGQPW